MFRLGKALSALRGIRDRRALLRALPIDSVGAEIGVWKGDFSKQILATVQPKKLHLIDPWMFHGEGEYARAWYGGRHELGQAGMDTIHAGVRARFADEIESGRIEICRAPSAEIALEFNDDYFDWVYIDGNHLYDYVMGDLRAYQPKVKPGGFIAGDDYADDGWWEGGVRRAVDEFAASGQVEVHRILGNQFILRKT